MPFYDQPGTHLINLAWGASLGAATGLGIWVYGLFGGSQAEETAEIYNGQPSLKWFASASSELKAHSRAGRMITPPPTLAWTPVVSLKW